MKRLIATIVSVALMLSTVLFSEHLYQNAIVAQAATQVSPPVPTNITATMVVLQKTEGYEYCREGFGWTDSNIFTNLATESTYHFYQRVAGKPETVSEPASIKTGGRVPCTISAEAPVLEWATHDRINLMYRQGYEYRINGGRWQGDWTFWDLEPDTEYVFEQRVAQTREEFAGEPSEPRIFKTAVRGPSSYTNIDRILDYIDANGDEMDGGIKGMAYVIDDEVGGSWYFGLYKEDLYPCFELFYDGLETAGLAFGVDFKLIPDADDTVINYQVVLASGDAIVDVVDTITRLDRASYHANYDFQISSGGNYLSAKDVNDLVNTGVSLLFAFWDEHMYADIGIGFKGVGFTSYKGKGAVFCDPAVGYHIGKLETRYQREAGCEINGCLGYLYCSVCGGKVGSSDSTPPKGKHTYDSECDRDCNVCGEDRRVIHSYIYGCSAVCAICGYCRDAAPVQHKLSRNGLCTVCDEKVRLPGDISGDGKVNVADVSKLYAHTRETSFITDPEALAVADITGDGKINVADVARLYAQVQDS